MPWSNWTISSNLDFPRKRPDLECLHLSLSFGSKQRRDYCPSNIRCRGNCREGFCTLIVTRYKNHKKVDLRCKSQNIDISIQQKLNRIGIINTGICIKYNFSPHFVSLPESLFFYLYKTWILFSYKKKLSTIFRIDSPKVYDWLRLLNLVINLFWRKDNYACVIIVCCETKHQNNFWVEHWTGKKCLWLMYRYTLYGPNKETCPVCRVSQKCRVMPKHLLLVKISVFVYLTNLNMILWKFWPFRFW